MTFEFDGSDLVLTIGQDGDEVRLVGQMESMADGVEEIRFADGTVFTAVDINEQFVATQITDGDDEVFGTGAGDVIHARAGDDYVSGGFGDDALFGDEGDDELWGDDGFNVLDGGEGNDLLYGNFELGDAFLIRGNFGADEIGNFSSSSDVIVFESAIFASFQDMLDASEQSGDDVLITVDAERSILLDWTSIEDLQPTSFVFADAIVVGSDRHEELQGDTGADAIYGMGGRDVLLGQDGDDVMFGGAGDDIMLGGAGDDRLDGGDGTNVLDGGAGDDVLTGAWGEVDIFVLGSDIGHDEITNFEPFQYDENENRLTLDIIRVDRAVFASFDDLVAAAEQDGYDTVIHIDADHTLRIDWMYVEDLDADNFEFVTPDIYGTTGADLLTGTAQGETIRGLGGDDAITGDGGDDTILGGAGTDTASFSAIATTTTSATARRRARSRSWTRATARPTAATRCARSSCSRSPTGP